MRKMSKLERTDLLRRLIDWIIACDLPFNTVSHPAFHHFVKGLNYGFKVPSRQLVGGKLLDEAVERCNEAILELCEGFEFGVTIHDGWTDTELYPIINAMVTLISTKRGKSDTVHALSDHTNGETEGAPFLYGVIKKTVAWCVELHQYLVMFNIWLCSDG